MVDIDLLTQLIVGVGIIGFIAEVIMNYMAQRSVSNQISLGIQAIIGINNMNAIDRAMERREKQNKST